MIHSINNIHRTFMFQAAAAPSYWAEALLAATTLINLLPTKMLHGSTPYFAVLGKHPDNPLHMFSCLWYLNLSSTSRHKLAPCSARPSLQPQRLSLSWPCDQPLVWWEQLPQYLPSPRPITFFGPLALMKNRQQMLYPNNKTGTSCGEKSLCTGICSLKDDRSRWHHHIRGSYYIIRKSKRKHKLQPAWGLGEEMATLFLESRAEFGFPTKLLRPNRTVHQTFIQNRICSWILEYELVTRLWK